MGLKTLVIFVSLIMLIALPDLTHASDENEPPAGCLTCLTPNPCPRYNSIHCIDPQGAHVL